MDIGISARRLENFLRVSTEELRDFARLNGHDDTHKLSIADLYTTNSEISDPYEGRARLVSYGGEGGIRTHGPGVNQDKRLAGVPDRPLQHLSAPLWRDYFNMFHPCWKWAPAVDKRGVPSSLKNACQLNIMELARKTGRLNKKDGSG